MEDFVITMNVPDMSCAHCVQTIRNAVSGIDASARCDVDLDARRVVIDSPLPPSDFVEALEEAGYTPELLRALG
jgi:copper chaperone